MLALLLSGVLFLPYCAPDTTWTSGKWKLRVDVSGLGKVSLHPYAYDESPFGFQREWGTKFAGSEVVVSLWTYDQKRYEMRVVEDVCGLEHYQLQSDEDPSFRPSGHRLIPGKLGSRGLACAAWGTVHRGEKGKSYQAIQVGSLLPGGSYAFEVTAKPALGDAERDKLIAALVECVKYEGSIEGAQWSEEEARARWNAVTDENLHDELRVKRTEHFILLTNSAAYKQCSKKLEDFYEQIRKAYPFQEVAGRKLLPVFLFRTREQYLQFCIRKGDTRESAEATAGHAYEDYYATTFASPRDPTHLHELVHQLFRMRMGLSGGGSWFQEGVADYLAENANHIKSWSKRVSKRGQFAPFAMFMTVPSLLGTAKSAEEGEDRYRQASSMIYFLAKSRKLKKHFPDFVYQMGTIRRGDTKAAQYVLRDLYGMSIPEYQQAWVRYWERGGRD